MSLPASPGASSASSTSPPPVTMSSSSLAHAPSLPPPTNARGNPRRPPKLRSSCDACGAAKVRCDKTQPRCGRCAAGGLTCVYGLSRKFGKAPRKKPPVDTSVPQETMPRPVAQGAQQQAAGLSSSSSSSSSSSGLSSSGLSSSCCPDFRHLSTGPPRPIKYEPVPVSGFGIEDNLMAMNGVYPSHHHHHQQQHHQHHHQDLFLRSPTALDGFDDPFAFSDTPTSATFGGPDPRGTVDPLDLTFPAPDYSGFADWMHPDDLMHTTPEGSDAGSAPPSLSSSSRNSSLDCLHHHHHGFPDATATTTTTTTTTTMAAAAAAAAAADAHNCHRLACSTLEGLSFRQETLALAKGEPLTQTMDKVLNRNKQAVANMHQLLQCACSKSPHLAMLYASITSKILMWYQLAAGCTKPTTSWDYFSALGGAVVAQPTPPLSASSSPSLAFVQPGSPVAVAHAHAHAHAQAQANPFVVTPMQFSVGAFSVDDESAQEALRRQLLLSELKKAGNLIDLLSIQGRDELATGEVNDIYSALGTWLKCELNRTISFLRS